MPLFYFIPFDGAVGSRTPWLVVTLALVCTPRFRLSGPHRQPHARGSTPVRPAFAPAPRSYFLFSLQLRPPFGVFDHLPPPFRACRFPFALLPYLVSPRWSPPSSSSPPGCFPFALRPFLLLQPILFPAAVPPPVGSFILLSPPHPLKLAQIAAWSRDACAALLRSHPGASLGRLY